MPDALPAPRLKPPPGACDTHMHFYGPFDRYPLAPTSPNQPPLALVEDYRKVQARLGLERVVVVQASGYAFDNSCAMDAVGDLGDCARAIVVVALDTPEAELQRLADAGAVGIRVFMLPGGVYDWSDIDDIDAIALNFGWHLQFQFDGREMTERAPLLRRMRSPLVIDHTGKFLEPVAPDNAAFIALRHLVDAGVWVKLSAPYETSKVGAPHYDDVAALAKVLVDQTPERMLWASNWPHPSVSDPRPDDGMLLDCLLDWIADEAVRKRVLVTNPAELYGFDNGLGAG